MTFSTSGIHSAANPKPVFAQRPPRPYPTPIMAARARRNDRQASTLVARSQYAFKPMLMVAAEYVIAFASLGVAGYLSFFN